MNRRELKMNWRDLKSKTGMVLIGLYLLPFILILVEFIVVGPPYDVSILLLKFTILTMPGSIVLGIIFYVFGFYVLGIGALENGELVGLILVFFGFSINALGLYFLGYSLAIMFADLKGSIRNFLSRPSRK